MSEFQKKMAIQQYKNDKREESQDRNVTDKISNQQFTDMIKYEGTQFQQTLFDVFQTSIDRIKKEAKNQLDEHNLVLDLIRERKIHKLEINFQKPSKNISIDDNTDTDKSDDQVDDQKLIEDSKDPEVVKVDDQETKAVNDYLEENHLISQEINKELEDAINEDINNMTEEALEQLQKNIMDDQYS